MAVMQTVLDLPVLSSERLYHFEFDHLPPRLTREEEQAMVAQARAGNQGARSRLAEDTLRYMVALAWKFAQGYRHDFMDLVAQGHFILMENLDHALASYDPPACLRAKIGYGFIDYCHATQTVITTPHWRDRRGEKAKPLSVASLDNPINEDEKTLLVDMIEDPHPPILAHPSKEEPDYTALYTAIDTVLTERQRDVILRHFGLRGCEPQSLYQISEVWYGKKFQNNGTRRKRKSSAVAAIRTAALKKLHAALSPAPMQERTADSFPVVVLQQA